MRRQSDMRDPEQGSLRTRGAACVRRGEFFGPGAERKERRTIG